MMKIPMIKILVALFALNSITTVSALAVEQNVDQNAISAQDLAINVDSANAEEFDCCRPGGGGGHPAPRPAPRPGPVHYPAPRPHPIPYPHPVPYPRPIPYPVPVPVPGLGPCVIQSAYNSYVVTNAYGSILLNTSSYSDALYAARLAEQRRECYGIIRR